MKQPLQLKYTPNEGATKFLVKANRDTIEVRHDHEKLKAIKNCYEWFDGSEYIKTSPIQKGNEYYIQEENFIDNKQNIIMYKANYENQHLVKWQPASQMTHEQSRFKGTCIGVEVKKVQELTPEEILVITMWDINSFIYNNSVRYDRIDQDFKDWTHEQFGANTYNNNDYFWVVTVK